MRQTAHHHSPLNTAGFAHPARNVAALGVEPGMQVADFGSGSGAYTLAIAERLANAGHVYAIDVQRDLLRRLKNEAHQKGFKNVEVIWADIEQPRASKIAASTLDLVLVSNLLFQLDRKDAVLAEARRVLKVSGRLVIIDWSESFNNMGPTKKDVVTKEAAKKLSEDAGFRFAHEFAAGAHHYGLVFAKTT